MDNPFNKWSIGPNPMSYQGNTGALTPALNWFDSFRAQNAATNTSGMPAGYDTAYGAQINNGAAPAATQATAATPFINTNNAVWDSTELIPQMPQQQPHVVGNTVAPTVGNTNQAGSFNPIGSAPASFNGYGSRQYTEGLLQDQSDLARLGQNNVGTSGFAWGNPSSWNWQGIGTGLGVANNVFNAYLGYEQLQQGKDQLAFTKDAWQKNYDMQRDAYDREVSAQDSRHAKWNPVGG